jgi:regulatory factor X
LSLCFITEYPDCGIRPATSAEAEFLQDYIRKTNNQAAQRSVDAARLATEQSDGAIKGEDGSGEDEEDESEGSQSGPSSKRNSLNLSAATKGPMFAEEKTPTAGSLLAQAQTQSTRTISTQAPIRRHTVPHELPGGSPPAPTFLGSTPSLSAGAEPSSSQLPGAISAITTSSGSIRLVPQFPSIEEAIGANSTSPEGVAAREVWGWFTDHLDALLDSIRSWRCDQFEMHLRQFWSSLSGNHREVVHAPAVAGLMAKADAILYDVSWGFSLIA